MIEIARPYALFLADADGQDSVVADFLLRWRRQDCVGRIGGARSDLPELSFSEAVERGARTLVIVAESNGAPKKWHAPLSEALEAGLDIASRLPIAEIAPVAKTAKRLGRIVRDVRCDPGSFPPATGKRRAGRRVLTIGTDRTANTLTAALSIERDLKSRGAATDFRATTPLGILVAGGGVPLGAVASDALTGAVETLCPAASPDHWDVVEGRASLGHPADAPVALALLHGAQPDAIVLCHDPQRRHLEDLPHVPMPYLSELVALHERAARLTNPAAAVLGVALDTGTLPDAAARDAVRRVTETYGLPCCDPHREGTAPIVDRLLALA